MSILEDVDVRKKLNEIEYENIVYYDSNEMGEIFITLDDLFDQLQDQSADEVSICTDIYVSGDPMKEIYLDFNTKDSFMTFLNSFE